PGLFAAIAPSAAPFVIPEKMPPIPVFHSAGLQDAIVAFNLQRRTFEAIKVLNGCEQKGKPYAAGALLFESPHKTPVVTMVHEGGHSFDSIAAPQMVRFFKENPRSVRAPSSPPKAAAPAKPEPDSKPAPSKEPASGTPAAPPAPP